MKKDTPMKIAYKYGFIKKKEYLMCLNIAKYGRLKCELCKCDLKKSTMDHIIPKSKGGTNELDNLRLTHSKCNEKRGNKFRLRDMLRLLVC